MAAVLVWRAAGIGLLVATVLAGVKWAVPVLADRVVASMPVSLDEQIGLVAFNAVQRQWLAPSRLSDERIEQVQAVFYSVTTTGRIPVRLAVMSAHNLPPNALAFTNGQIVITDSMVLHILGKRGDFDDQSRAQLAGVLAHEIGHIEGRHSMHALARGSLMAVLSATLFGDCSEAIRAAGELAAGERRSR